jgi:hypothetical protein
VRVDELRQGLSELLEKFLLGETGMLGDVADSLLPECRAELPRFNWLILPGSKPGVDGLVVPRGLELIKETTNPANEATIGWRSISTTPVGVDGWPVALPLLSILLTRRAPRPSIKGFVRFIIAPIAHGVTSRLRAGMLEQTVGFSQSGLDLKTNLASPS